MNHTVVPVVPELAVANTTDVSSPDATASVSKSNVLKFRTSAIVAIAASDDLSIVNTMSKRSSNCSSIPTGMTAPPPPTTDTNDNNMEEEEGPPRNETEVSETSNRILDVILEYSLNKFDSTAELHQAGRPKFLGIISRFVRAQEKVLMCLPAFPFKSANKVEKVLGSLPDKAEELALGRLNTMCATIGRYYEPGAELTIISDGLVYNDLLGISDQETWRYGSALRAMADDKAFSHLGFSRLRDLVAVENPPSDDDDDDDDELSYVANAAHFRRHLLSLHGRDGDIDIDHEIATKPDTLMTYRGYCRFLESDLKYIFGSSGVVLGNGREKSNRAYKRDVKYLAKQMLIRGYAFAAAIKSRFPNHLRLSIHQSTGEHKISLSLLNTKTGFTTPWHCAVALMSDGETWVSGLMADFKADGLLELVYDNDNDDEEDGNAGRPSYFREVERKSPCLGLNSGNGGDGDGEGVLCIVRSR